MAQQDPIKHIVVLMLENHSFDQILGWTKAIYPELEGVDEAHLHSNPDYPDTSTKFTQAPTAEMSIQHDPHHEHVDVLAQIANDCNGFVEDFARRYPTSDAKDRAQIMGYYPKGALPVIHTLAEHFMICDHWYSSMPGPTWPNRFFVHTGTCKGHVKMPAGVYIKNEHFYDQNTIYDELEHKGIHAWSIYHHGMPQSLILARLWDKPEHFHRMGNFFEDARGPEERFPVYAFVEPCYGGAARNDQHPPSDIRHGEYLIAQVYNALRGNDDLWNSTLFVLLYDEHGGFYDHANPPPAVPPDDYTKEYSFNQYGVRVPALLISPWVKRGVLSKHLDHTSLLKHLIEKWELRPGQLGRRVEQAETFSEVLQELKQPRTVTPGPFEMAKLPMPALTDTGSMDDHQRALVSFSHFLEQRMAHVEEFSAVGYRALQCLDGAAAQLGVAKDRFLLFLHHSLSGRIKQS